MMPDNFSGIILYDIEMDDCLNGVYTNIPDGGVILNECCRKKTDSPKIESDRIIGHYASHWFDMDSNPVNGTLEITNHSYKEEKQLKVYSFLWKEGSNIVFRGVGYKMNHNQIAVTYWCSKI
jgi:hypothetical protein